MKINYGKAGYRDKEEKATEEKATEDKAVKVVKRSTAKKKESGENG